jgi:hypothetical protein
MPPAFPETDFRAFGAAAHAFFPELVSDENLNDKQERRRHFDWSWQAVRYRYRVSAECNREFKALLANASKSWREGWGDEELNYKLDRSIYTFFMSALSVFDSFGFCLYFLGHAIRPGAFPSIANPRGITRKATICAFGVSFPDATITALLAALPQDEGFATIEAVRNLLAHRISGRRSVRASSTLPDGITWREDVWYIPGSNGKLIFDEELLQHYLDDVTRLLTTLSAAARLFAESQTTPPSSTPRRSPHDPSM